MKADLHIHTTVSDGLTGPVEALRLAASLGIDVVAITDHDTDAALPLLGEAGALPVAVLPGVEMDTRLDGLPLEILVYGHRVGAEPLAGMLAGAAGRRSRRAEILWTALRRALGAELPPLSALLPPPRRVITRPQMVDCLLEARVLPHRQGAREAVAFYDPGFDPPSTEEAFRAGQVDTIIVIPESQSGVVDMKLFLPTMDVKKTIILLKLNGPLKKYENYLRETNGIRLNYQETKGKSNTTYEFLYSVIIPILMLFPALIAGSIVIDTVSEEFENKTFDTLVSAPVSLGQIFASKLSAAVATVVVQVIMWSALLRLNGLPIQRPELVIPFAVVIATIICFVAAIISLYFKDRERSQFVYSIVLVMGVGGSYFLDASPFSLITRLAYPTWGRWRWRSIYCLLS